MTIDPYQLALGAVLGIAGTAAVRWWQYKRDLWLGEIDRFCDTLDAAAECATEYWLREKHDTNQWEEAAKEADEKILEQKRDIDLYEARLIGYQTRLDGLSSSINERLNHSDALKLNKSMQDLSDALTGGNYGTIARDADPDRAQLAQVFTSDMVVDVRRSLARSLSLRGTLLYFWEKLSRQHMKRYGYDRQ